MKLLLPVFALFLLLTLMSSLSTAADEVTVKGTLTCAKCDLKETAECQNVLVVKDGDKETKYYVTDNALGKDYHDKVCKKARASTSVTGTVEEKDGKKWITASKID